MTEWPPSIAQAAVSQDMWPIDFAGNTKMVLKAEVKALAEITMREIITETETGVQMNKYPRTEAETGRPEGGQSHQLVMDAMRRGISDQIAPAPKQPNRETQPGPAKANKLGPSKK